MWSRTKSLTARVQSRASRVAWFILCLVVSLVLCRPDGLVAAQRGPPPTQPPGAQLSFRSLTRAQGLAHPSVRSILQDRRGFMWFGTGAGLNRYDGYHFTSFPSEPDMSAGTGTATVTALA